jgi:hypothetical protein
MVAPASVNTGLEDGSSNGAAVGLSLEEGGGCSNEDCWDEGSKVDSGEGCWVDQGCSVVCSWNVVGSVVDCSEEGAGACSVVGSWKKVEGEVVGSMVDCSGLDDGVCGVVT